MNNLTVTLKFSLLFVFVCCSLCSCNDDEKEQVNNISGYWQQKIEHDNVEGDILYFTNLGEYYVYKKVNTPFKTTYTFFTDRFYVLKQGKYTVSGTNIRIDDESREYILKDGILSIKNDDYNPVFSYPFVEYNQRPSISENLLKDLNNIFYYTLATPSWGIFYENFDEISIGCVTIEEGDSHLPSANKNSIVTFHISEFTYAYTTLEGYYVQTEPQDIVVENIAISDKRIVNGLKAALIKIKLNGKYKIWIPWELHNGEERLLGKERTYDKYTTIAYTIELVSIN